MWAGMSLAYRFLAILGVLGLLWAGYSLWHHKVWQDGYDTAIAAIEAKDAARLAAAQVIITKNGAKHAKSRQTRAGAVGYSAPASPLVAAKLHDSAARAAVRPRRPVRSP